MLFTESPQIHANVRAKKVMTFGTFDLFHPGHIYYLSEAKKYGDILIIVIARDSRVLERKGRLPIDSEKKRLEKIQHAFPEALVLLGDEKNIFTPIDTHTPDIIAIGYDQHAPLEILKQKYPQIHIVKISGHETDKWKSSILRETKQ